jgi:hypothetical protein
MRHCYKGSRNPPARLASEFSVLSPLSARTLFPEAIVIVALERWPEWNESEFSCKATTSH